MEEIEDPIITEHAQKRIKERANVKGKRIQTLAKGAFEKGLKHKEVSGSLKRYLDKEYLIYKTANNIRIYQYKIFLFNNDTLITVFDIPKCYRKTIQNIYRKRKGKKNEL